MGYKVRVQKVDRPTSRSYYVNLPLVIAETMGVEKGEVFEWTLDNANTLSLKRIGKEKKKVARKGKRV
jgi:hypothetical protein